MKDLKLYGLGGEDAYKRKWREQIRAKIANPD